MKVTPKLIEGFLDVFLVPYLDDPQATPPFHRKMWDLVCDEHRFVALAAPRKHAKTTGVTKAYVMCELLFGGSDFALILSETYDKAVKFLGGIVYTLRNNPDVKNTFGPIVFEKDTQDEVIVRTRDAWFCIVVRGSEQNLRGILWGDKPPNLIVGDDMESDEMVNNPERRRAFKKNFLNVVIPCGSRNCKYRILGTILHFDSMLENFLNSSSWKSLRFKAHESMTDFSNILWPEMFPEKRLREIQELYRNQYNLDGYSQEYLNIPVSIEDQYFRQEDFLEMTDEDRKSEGFYYAACDLAVSTKERADFTVIGVMKRTADGFHHVVDVRRLKVDSLGSIDEMMAVQERYEPELFGIESGQIKLAIGPFLDVKMREKGVSLNLHPLTPSGDKPTRGKSIQAMMKAGAVKFDKGASWYPALEDEMMKMTNSGAKSGHDDMFDVMAYLGLMCKNFSRPDTVAEINDYEFYTSFSMAPANNGMNAITGY